MGCFIIAEVGLAHDGSLMQAHAYIDACAKAGADAAKFQCHTGDPSTEWRVVPHWTTDATRQDYWKRTAFTEEQWMSLAWHCHEVGVEFMCSVFSLEALRIIDPLVKRHKVPSGQITNLELLRAIRETKKPVFLSAGMCTIEEFDTARHILPKADIVQCTSLYPCPAEKIGLWRFQDGLSDHSGAIYPGIAAAALGLKSVEVHVCFSKDYGFDGPASLTIPEFRQLVEGMRFVEKAMQPVDKDALAKGELAETRRVFMGANA